MSPSVPPLAAPNRCGVGQNHPLPADLDLGRYASVAIWCDRFNVSFGAAGLTRT
jgi:hypothetical protein